MFPGCSLASFLNRSETLLPAFCTVLALLQPARKSQRGRATENNLLNFNSFKMISWSFGLVLMFVVVPSKARHRDLEVVACNN